MAENLTVARPYAEAVFGLASEEKSFDKWQTVLCAMSEAVKDPFYLGFLKNSSSPDDASKCFVKLLTGIIDTAAENFIKLLAANGRLEVLPEIYDEFCRLKAKHDKVLTVHLTSARRYADADLEVLKKKLSEKYDCSIDLEQHLDPTLIGGAVLKIGDKVIDASIKTSLVNLSSTLR
ncbi:MAG: F0F1 ATP synthase subunit delta [Succinatimonas sp.]|nr:F0F1 ATP synthase subunit delta [Succinatimonas sp.]